MKLSMKNKFPNQILFPEIPTFFEITTNQTLFIVLSVLNFVYIGRRARIPNSKIFQARYWVFTCLKFSATNQSNSVLLLVLI